MSRVIAVIPARKGSKRIPHKNTKEFCGKPLAIWTIIAACKTEEIDNVIVTTDDEYLLDMCSQFDVKTIIRDPYLCTDEASSWDVAQDAMNQVQAKPDDILIYLQPTSPLRTYRHIRAALMFFNLTKSDAVISAYPCNKLNYGFKLTNGYLDPLFHKAYLKKRSQDLPEAYLPNGAIYIIKYGDFLTYHSFYGPLTKVFRMMPEYSVDIDDMNDFLYAEFLMRMRLMKNE